MLWVGRAGEAREALKGRAYPVKARKHVVGRHGLMGAHRMDVSATVTVPTYNMRTCTGVGKTTPDRALQP